MSRKASQFVAARRALEAERAAKRREERRAARGGIKVKDFESVSEYLRARRMIEREKTLNAIVPARVCPCCGLCKESSRQWVVFPRVKLAGVEGEPAARVRAAGVTVGRDVACCKSCVMRVRSLRAAVQPR